MSKINIQLIEDLISAMEYHVEQTRPIYSTTVALQAAREELKSLTPQRTWVGLTDEEISARAANFYSPEMYKRAVLWAQEKLKERNQ